MTTVTNNDVHQTLPEIQAAAGVPSPSNTPIHKFTDAQLNYSFIEFPADTIFMESLAQSAVFAPHVAYVPVLRWVPRLRHHHGLPSRTKYYKETHIYEIRVGQPRAQHVCGPLATPHDNDEEESREITAFGSAMDSTGVLYLCCFNRNSILALNLARVIKERSSTKQRQVREEHVDELGTEMVSSALETKTEATDYFPVRCDYELKGVSSPNDVAVDPRDEHVLYVVGGAFQKCCCNYSFSNSSVGEISKVLVPRDGRFDRSDIYVFDEGLRTLAGVEVSKTGELWVAQLFDILRQKEPYNRTVAWSGYDGQGQVWLADNIEVFDDSILLCPAYSTTSAAAVDNIMKRQGLASCLLIMGQLVTAIMRREYLAHALIDPEVSLAFSNTYIREGETPKPIRLMFLEPHDKPAHAAAVYESGNQTRANEANDHGDYASNTTAYHFEIDLETTRANYPPWEVLNRRNGKPKGFRHYFNEQVTHAAQLKGQDGSSYIACVNFEQPRIMLLDDQLFRSTMQKSRDNRGELQPVSTF